MSIARDEDEYSVRKKNPSNRISNDRHLSFKFIGFAMFLNAKILIACALIFQKAISRD